MTIRSATTITIKIPVMIMMIMTIAIIVVMEVSLVVVLVMITNGDDVGGGSSNYRCIIVKMYFVLQFIHNINIKQGYLKKKL